MESLFPLIENPNEILNFIHHPDHQLYPPTPSPSLQCFDQNDIKLDINNFLHIQNPILETVLPSINPCSSYEDTWSSLGSVSLHLNPNQENQITTPHYIVDKTILPSALHQYECHLIEPTVVPKVSESIEDYACDIPDSDEAPAKIQCYQPSIYPEDQILETNQLDYIDAFMPLPSSAATSSSVSSSQIATNPIIPLEWEP